MDVSRRKFFKICAGGMAGTTAAALGFAPKMALAQARNFKLLRAKEIRNTCTYCSVGCGLLMYSLGDGAKNAKEAIYHIEGDPDHPVSRGALCPKGAGLLDFIHSESRLKFPEYRAPGSDKWQQISLGRSVRSHRPTDESRPRRQLYREKTNRHHRQPLVDYRDAVRLRLQ